MLILRGAGLSVRYGERIILDGAEFRAIGGTTTAIVGPSGTGKTTLLGILGGLIKPDRGRVELTNGTLLASTTSALLKASAWVHQTTNILSHRSVLDNVLVGPRARGRPDTEGWARSFEALDAVGLGLLEQKTGRQLSGGERQRLAIARALASQSLVLLADEPTGQLDAGTSSVVIDSLTGFARGPDRLVVLATHDLALARRCDRIVTIRGGKVVDG